MTIDERAEAEIRKLVLTMKIIVLSLSAGVFVFAIVVLSQGLPDPQAPWGMLTLISLFFAVGAVALRLVVPRVIAANIVRQIAGGQSPPSPGGVPNGMILQTTAGQLAAAFQTKTIVACALLEGAAFFALIAHMMEHHLASLIVAVVLFAALVLHLPTVAGVSDWVQQQLRFLEEQRHLSS